MLHVYTMTSFVTRPLFNRIPGLVHLDFTRWVVHHLDDFCLIARYSYRHSHRHALESHDADCIGKAVRPM